jgi:hypothetical protein
MVGAFGLDDAMQKEFARLSGYHPPRALDTIAIKLHPADPEVVDRFSGRIESFVVPVPGTSFAAIVPKGDHLSMVLAGRDVTTRHLLRFLELPHVKQLLDIEGEFGSAFRGAFPNGRARSFYGDRFVLTGDATGLVRPFKGKGINSAVITGIRAAETMMNEGISWHAFSKYERRCERLAGDMNAGKLVQLSCHLLGRTLGMAPLVRYAAASERLRAALYGAVSGTWDYKNVLLTMLSPGVLFGLTGAYLRRLIGLGRSPEPVSDPDPAAGRRAGRLAPESSQPELELDGLDRETDAATPIRPSTPRRPR